MNDLSYKMITIVEYLYGVRTKYNKKNNSKVFDSATPYEFVLSPTQRIKKYKNEDEEIKDLFMTVTDLREPDEKIKDLFVNESTVEIIGSKMTGGKKRSKRLHKKQKPLHKFKTFRKK